MAVLIVASAAAKPQAHRGGPTALRAVSMAPAPPAASLSHCQQISPTAPDGAACEAVWAEIRQRFFAQSASNAR